MYKILIPQRRGRQYNSKPVFEHGNLNQKTLDAILAIALRVEAIASLEAMASRLEAIGIGKEHGRTPNCDLGKEASIAFNYT